MRHHQLQEHTSGVGVSRQTPAWIDEAPEALRHMYHLHRSAINAPHQLHGDVIHHYNIPGNHEGGFTSEELAESLRYVYQHEGRAIKIQVAFGSILQHREMHEYRYFHPHRNAHLFAWPLQIADSSDLRSPISDPLYNIFRISICSRRCPKSVPLRNGLWLLSPIWKSRYTWLASRWDVQMRFFQIITKSIDISRPCSMTSPAEGGWMTISVFSGRWVHLETYKI